MNLLAQDWFVILGVGLSTFVFSMLWADRIVIYLHRKSLGSRDYVMERFKLMEIQTSEKKLTQTMLLLSFGLGAIFFLLLWPNIFLSFFFGGIVTIIGWQIPKFAADALYQSRCKKFVSQMVDGLTLMANGNRSGLAIQEQVKRVAQNLPNPISQEFDRIDRQIQMGVSVEEALNTLAMRIPEPDVQMFVVAINVLREKGGDMAQTFDTIVEVIRERQKIQQKIEAMTAQGKMQGIIMSIVPFILLAIFSAIDPSFIRPLFTSTLGVIFLFIMLALQITGGIMMRKIVTIKV